MIEGEKNRSATSLSVQCGLLPFQAPQPWSQLRLVLCLASPRFVSHSLRGQHPGTPTRTEKEQPRLGAAGVMTMGTTLTVWLTDEMVWSLVEQRE